MQEWKKRTTAVIVLVAFSVFVTFAVLWLSMGSRAKLFRTVALSWCTADSCLEHAARLTESMDRTVQPCQDFYAYVCGKWKPYADETYISDVAGRMRASLLRANSIILYNGSSRQSSFKKVSATFKSCIERKSEDQASNIKKLKKFMFARGIPWPQDPPEDRHPLDVLLDLDINWGIPVLFKTRLFSNPLVAVVVRSNSLTDVVLGDKKLREYFEEGSVKKRMSAFYSIYTGETPSVGKLQRAQGIYVNIIQKAKIAIVDAEGFVRTNISDLQGPTSAISNSTNTWLALLKKHFRIYNTSNLNGSTEVVTNNVKLSAVVNELIETYAWKDILSAIGFWFVELYTSVAEDQLLKITFGSTATKMLQVVCYYQIEQRYAVEGTELHYYVNGVGEVFFGINGEEKGLFLNGVDTRTPLWALVDIYGNTTTIQMVDAVRQLNNHNELSTANRAGPLDADLIQRIEQLGVCLPEAAAEPAAVGPSADMGRPLPASRAGSLTNVTATPFPFSTWLPLAYHIVRGPNVRFSALDRVVAEREDLSRGRAFVFTSRTVRPNERLQVKVVGVDGSFSESLTFGLTTCNPGSLEDTVRSLPEDTDALYDRPEYWVFKKDLKCGLDDELVFVTGDDGRVLFSRNSGSFETVMHVDGTQQFYMFFNICGYVTKLRLVGTMRGAPVPSAAEAPEEPQAEPKGKLQSLMPEEADVDCRICFESPIESVLCNCGHSLTCHACGLKLLKGNSPQCPVCRQPIINVVRIYKA
ncbi:protein neuralized [Ixodes scapularis]